MKTLTFEEFVKNNPEEIDSEGRTRLMRAMKEAFISQELLEGLVKAEKDINSKDKNGLTASMHAVKYSVSGRVLDYLFEHGADIDATDNQKYTTLHHDAESSCFNERTLLILLKHKANPLAVNKQGLIPLQLAQKHVLAFYKDPIRKLEEATQAAQDKRAKVMTHQMGWYKSLPRDKYLVNEKS